MAREQDQSMEEILQSIKRIIADEAEPAPSGSDVLELTELLSEDDTDALLGNNARQADSANASDHLSLDEIMAAPTDAALSAAPSPAPVAPAPASPPPAVAPAVTMAPAKAAPATDDALLSDRTLASSMAALNALRSIPDAPLPPMPASGLRTRAGTTIEDLVIEALRPMLKDWLDTHLTTIVERMVDKEVRRLSGH